MAVGKRAGLLGFVGGLNPFNWVRHILAPPPPPAPEPSRPTARIRTLRAYDQRKQNLPRAFTVRDWERALEYWGHSCAICGRPRGLWHTLAQDHWVPLTHADCPGTVPTNILPLCHGEDGCNNSKGKKDPEEWLVAKLGRRRANRKLREITAYFEWVHAQEPKRLGCPECGAPVTQAEWVDYGEVWHCGACQSTWDDAALRTFANCPVCECWMAPYDETHYYCPRCAVAWEAVDVPNAELCPGCEQGILHWMADGDGWWLCHHCGGEWVDAEA